MHSKIAGALAIALLPQWASPALAADPLKIGVMMPTSGVFAVLGERQLNGMRFAIEEAGGEIAGRKIEMLHEDTEGKPDVGLAKARKLVLSDRVDLMAGIINSAVALAVAPYLSSQRMPLVLSNASTDVLTGEKCDRYVFRVSYSSSQITEPIGLWMAKHAPKNLYILASDYVAPHEYVAAMKKGYLAGGGTVVGETYTPFNRTQDYGPYISQARSANPEHPQFRAMLASAYGLKGDTERAAAELAEARRLNSDDRYSSIARLRTAGGVGLPKVRALSEATFFAGLRLAGMPEE